MKTPARWAVESFDLGPAAFDPAAALQVWLSREGAVEGALLEKAEGAARRAYIAAAPFEILRVADGRARREGRFGKAELPGNPFEALGARLKSFRLSGRPGAFSTGAFGALSYEMARHVERLPPRRDLPQEAALFLFDAILVCGRRAELHCLLPGAGRAQARRRAALRAEGLALLLSRLPRPAPLPVPGRLAEMAGTLGRAGFYRGVRKIKEHIRAGDIFQCVLSERFSVPLSAGPARIYQALARACPSPYQFWLKDGETDVVGASPERLVKVEGRRARNCPIAGTRPRGESPRRDRLLERALKRSPKERAEHLMLVDLARNDLGRVCVPGSVKVSELMEVRRFSNVMHLVSEVEGRLEEASAWETLKASFPAGTVSGAPKVRAMEIIAGLEPAARGFYAGAIVQHDFSGNLDTSLTIRALSLRRGVAVLQAGAGVVADSSPEREYREVLNKLRALRQALVMAEAP